MEHGVMHSDSGAHPGRYRQSHWWFRPTTRHKCLEVWVRWTFNPAVRLIAEMRCNEISSNKVLKKASTFRCLLSETYFAWENYFRKTVKYEWSSFQFKQVNLCVQTDELKRLPDVHILKAIMKERTEKDIFFPFSSTIVSN